MSLTASGRRKLPQLAPDLAVRFEALAQACPYPLGITSAWRSSARQAELYAGWKARLPGYNPANPPGTSKHERERAGKPAAEALDIAYPAGSRAAAVAWCHEHAHEFGLHFPIRREDWHAESNGRPVAVPTTPTSQEDEMTPADWKQLNQLLDDKLRIVLRAEGSDGKPTQHPNLRSITERLEALTPRLVTIDGHAQYLVTPATGAVHVVSMAELSAWRKTGTIAADAKPTKITQGELEALQAAAEARQ